MTSPYTLSLAAARAADTAPEASLKATDTLEQFISRSEQWILAANLGYMNECIDHLNQLCLRELGTPLRATDASSQKLAAVSLACEILYAGRDFQELIKFVHDMTLPQQPDPARRQATATILLCASRAAGVSRDPNEARRLLERATTLYSSESAPLCVEGLRALVSAQLLHFNEARTVDAAREIDVAVALLRNSNRPTNLAFALRIRGAIQKATGNVYSAVESFLEAYNVSVASGNKYQISQSLQHLSVAKYRLGEVRSATVLARLALRHLPKHSKPQDILQCGLTHVRCLLFEDRFEEVLAKLQTLPDLQATTSYRLLAISREYRGLAQLGLGFPEDCLASIDEATSLLDLGQIRSYERQELSLRRCEALNALGKHKEVLQLCDAILAELTTGGETLEVGHVLRQKALASFCIGRASESLVLFDAAEAALLKVCDKYELLKLYLDRIELFNDNYVRAQRDAEQAVALATQVGVESLCSRARASSELIRVRATAHKREQTNEVDNHVISSGLIAAAASTRIVLLRAAEFGSHDLPVLVTGETGVGKDVVARTIHGSSHRRHAQLVSVNCASLPDTLMERELFGHIRGSFTGAERDGKGLIDVADKGTLFLDEIGELALPLQAKLLRLLQDGSYRPVGSTAEKYADLRVIAATHRDLRQMMAIGEFREDLYYRIACLRIHVPPLRERPEDIDAIAKRVMEEASAQHGISIWMEKESWQLLRRLGWPGNVRQLQMVMRAMCVHSLPEGVIRTRHLEEQMGDEMQAVKANRTLAPLHLQREVEAFERRLILNALRQSNFCRTSAAKLLGLGRNTIYEKMKRLGMDPQDPEPKKSAQPRKRERKGEA